MIGSLLALSLTLLLGGAVAYPLSNEINYADEPSTSYARYASSTQLLTSGMSNFDGFLNVSLTDISFLQNGTNQNGYYYFDGSNFSFFADNLHTPQYAFNVLYSRRAYIGFYVEYDDNSSFYITPYWRQYNFTDYGTNDTFWFYVRDDAEEGVADDLSIDIYHNTYQLEEYFGYKIKQRVDFSGGTLGGALNPTSLDYDRGVYVGGEFMITVYNTSWQTYPLYFDFGVGLEERNVNSYSDGYTDGFNAGYDNGYSSGYNQGSSDGYSLGYAEGISITSTDFNSLFFSIADTPVIMLRSLFNFDLFGMNVFVAIMTMLTGILVIYVVKKVI